MARFVDQLGIGSHQPPSLKEQFDAGGLLGSGAYGVVRRSGSDPTTAIKAQGAQKSRIDNEADILAYLGNELGVTPAVRSVETEIGPGAESYLAMDNLAEQGYVTLADAQMGRIGERAELGKLLAEQAILEAWVARAGVDARDTHSGNVMVLPPDRPAASDGSRVKLIDVGLYERGLNPEERLIAQAYRITDAYEALGLEGMGQEFKYLAKDLLERGEIDTARNLMNDALGDVEARRQALTPAQYDRNIVATETMRFAGDALQPLAKQGLLPRQTLKPRQLAGSVLPSAVPF
jgi:hypothetical protein